MDSMTHWAPIVKAMPLSEAEDIYATKYAKAVAFDQDPSGVDCVLMDYGVNSGIGRPISVARALLKQPGGSKMDADLLNRITTTDSKWFINAVNAERLAFMKRIRGGSAWQSFGKGWNARMVDLSKYALALASGVNVAPHLPEPAEPKIARAHNPERPVVKDTAKVSTGVGGGGGGGLWAVGIDPWVISAFVLVVIAGVAAYFIYRNARTRKENQIVIPDHVPPEPVAVGG